MRHSANGKSTHPTLVFPFMATDKRILGSIHQLFPPAREAFALLKVYGTSCLIVISGKRIIRSSETRNRR